MRFSPKPVKEGTNVSDTHPLIEAGTLFVGLAAIFAFIAVVLVFLVEIALYFVPPEQEANLFNDWLPDDLTMVAPDDERLREVQQLVDRLSKHWPEAVYDFRVEVDDADTPNAMALPGGLIIVTDGLLDQVESENELAFVLGHELGHFKNRDHLRALGRGIVFAVFFAAVTGNDVGGVGIKAADVTLRGFSRRQETAADKFGLLLVNAEYGHVDEAWRLFERWQIDDTGIISLVTYLSTHPESGDRVADMKAYAAAQGWQTEGDVTGLQWSLPSTE